jgi:hypothetical protein
MNYRVLERDLWQKESHEPCISRLSNNSIGFEDSFNKGIGNLHRKGTGLGRHLAALRAPSFSLELVSCMPEEEGEGERGQTRVSI